MVPLFIRFMTPADAMIKGSKNCHNEVIISPLQGTIKRPIKEITCGTNCLLTLLSFAVYLPPSTIIFFSGPLSVFRLIG